MNKAEERAMEVYPPRVAYNSMVGVALKEKRDINANNRQKFIQGYVTAEQDLMEKFKMWVAHNGYTAKEAEVVYNDFKQFITED